jgi:competence protein ComEA
MFKVMLGVLLFTIITMVVFINIDPNLVTESISQTSITDGYLTVQVSGEVQSAGTYIVDKDATLQTLIDLAGGPTDNADPKTYLTTTQVISSKAYYIAPLHDPSDVCGTTLLIKVDLNSADKTTLMTLSNIGSSLADAIIGYRQEKSFTYLEEIMLVSGIGNATFSRIKNYITLM